MTDNDKTVFLIDDDNAVRHSISLSLTTEGFKVSEHSSAASFLSCYKEENGCLVSDIQMPEMTGLELQKELHRKGITIPLIFITGHGNISMSVSAIKAGAFDFIEKPFTKIQLIESIKKALNN